MASTPGQRPPRRRAFDLRRGGECVGRLGEGKGPFVSGASPARPYPPRDFARYTSLDAAAEAAVREAFEQAASFDDLVAALLAKGFELRERSYEDLFMPVERSPHGDPTFGRGGPER